MLHIQFIKYVVIGLLSNGILYLTYLGLTTYGLGHKTAMTLLYIVGIIQTFFLNKKWTFSHHGSVSSTLIRYILSYALGYILNLVALYYFVDQLLFPHQLIQGMMIIVNAFLLFILQKLWVFQKTGNESIDIETDTKNKLPLISIRNRKKRKRKKKLRSKRRKT